MLPGVMRSHSGAGTTRRRRFSSVSLREQVALCSYSSLTRRATQNFCGQYLVRFSRPRETSCIAASVDGCSTNTACLQHMQLGRFAGSVGQHVRERSGGLQSNSKAAKTGVGELHAIVRGQENRSPPRPSIKLPSRAVFRRSDHEKLVLDRAKYSAAAAVRFHPLKTGAQPY